MTEFKRVKINNILDSQIPEFLNEEYPLFEKILSQYYISQEHQTGVIDLASNLNNYKKIENFNNETFIDLQLPSVLLQNVLSFDDTILVSHTIGFPDKYGLIKINDEIITYTSKTANSFLGCIRGFSGIDSLQKDNNPEFLNFIVTEASDHFANSTVNNLSLIFFLEIFKNFKYQFLPGFEERNFTTGISIQNILSRAKDFYKTKGTDQSFKILFSVLYGKNIEVIKPQEYMLRPSDNNYFITKNILVEKISGDDPTLLKGSTLYQYISGIGSVSASIYNVEYRPVTNKDLYEISLDSTSFIGSFETTGTTKVLEYTPASSSIINVDSTVGFANSGTIIVKKTDSSKITLHYTDKTNTELLNVTGLSASLNFGDILFEDKLAYSYIENITTPIKFRVINVIDKVNFSKSSGLKIGDKISLSTFGKNLSNNIKFTNWVYNIPTYHNIDNIDLIGSNTYRITLKDDVAFYVNETIFIEDGIDIEATVIEVEDGYYRGIKNKIIVQSSSSLNISNILRIKKKLNKTSSDYFTDSNSIVGAIQNTYIDEEEKYSYINTSGLPNYKFTSTDTKTIISKVGTSTTSILNAPEHNFLTGDKIYYSPSLYSGISTGVYFLTKIDNDRISISYSNSDVFEKKYVQISNPILSDYIYKFGYENKIVKNQKLFKKFKLDNAIDYFDNENERTTFNRQIGLFINGVEIYSPTLFDENFYYGKINSIVVTNPGKDYDIINCPKLEVTDFSGSGCNAHLVVSGSLSEVKINSPGIGYDRKPKITLTGGNGTGAVLEPNLVKSKIISKFRADTNYVSTLNDTITFIENHNFDNAEEVTYITNGNSNIPGLIDKSNYFVGIVNTKTIKLYNKRINCLSGIGTVNITGISSGFQEFRSLNSKNTITKVYVKNRGIGYSNRLVKVSSDFYPTFDYQISGINTADNYIFAKNHGFKNGDFVRYSYEGTSITGISTDIEYIVSIIDDNKFKLSDAGIGTISTKENYLNKKYINLNSTGVGTHTFKYPPIEIKVEVTSGIGSTAIISPTLTPIVLGSAESVYIENGGVSYGSSEIINFHRRPEVRLPIINSALLRPIIINGSINDVQILYGGSGYDNSAKIIVYGEGKYADILPIVSNGTIIDTIVIDGGIGYKNINTTLNATRRGTDIKFVADIFEWKINQVEKNKDLIKKYDGDDETITYPNINVNLGLQLINFYLPKQLRKNISDNIKQDNTEIDKDLRHSPIVGWAYDGNPIYGPYGYTSLTDSTIKLIKSSYIKKSSVSGSLRPISYTNGFFVQDYQYNASGDLDQYNGRFCTTPEYPYGTYAYFVTTENISSILVPTYPYIVGNYFRDTPSFENFYPTFSQDKNISQYNLTRNFSNYYLNSPNSGYEILEKTSPNLKQDFIVKTIKKSGISSISIDYEGDNYSVDDVIKLSPTSDGTGVSAQISRVKGKPISNLVVDVSTFNDVVFYTKKTSILGVTSTPHNLINNDIVIISDISTINLSKLNGPKKIYVFQKSTGITTDIPSTSITGLSTTINVTDTFGFEVNDKIAIGSEVLTITGIIPETSQLLVNRSTFNGIHSVGLESVNLLPNKFEFFETEQIPFVLPQNRIVYFNSIDNIGFNSTGTTYSVVGVGTSTKVNRFVPSKSIYIPNHKFYTGQQLIYSYSSGIGISVSNSSTTSGFNLNNNQIVYAVNFGNDFLGISTLGFTTSIGIGNTLNSLFFNYDSNVGYSHSFGTNYSKITGKVENYLGIVTTSESHGLVNDDKIRFTVLPSREETISFRFDSQNKKITTGIIGFSSSLVSLGSSSSINIPGNTLKNGDKVIYYSGTTSIGNLVDKNIYYVLKQNPDKIQLCEYLSDTLTGIGLSFFNVGLGTHGIALINPPLSFSEGNKIIFDVSDSSLSNLRLEFYRDFNFKKKFEIDNLNTKKLAIERTDNSVTIQTNGRNIPSVLYYSFVVTSSTDVEKLRLSVDTEVNGYNKIDIRKSLLSSEQNIITINSQSFKFNLTQKPEYTSYTRYSGISSVYYDTNSKTANGPISKIRINSSGKSYSKLPTISSIGSSLGNGAIIYPESQEIGKIISIDRIKDGFDYPTDPTISPQLSIPVVCTIKDISRVDYIGILTGGKNYNTSPKLKVIGNTEIELSAEIQGNSVSKVNVIKNSYNLKSPLNIVAYNNSNGYEIDTIYPLITPGTVRVEFLIDNINPYIKSGYGATDFVFPFSIGDQIFVEKCRLTVGSASSANFNSKDYGYNYFTVVGVNTSNYSIDYTMSGLQTGSFGNYNNLLTYGYVVNKKDIAQFEMKIIDDSKYLSGERVTSSNFSAVVMENGWDNDNKQIRLIDAQGTLNIGDRLLGEKSKLNGIVKYANKFNLPVTFNVTRDKINDFGDRVGFLNDSQQRISDNKYYQKFSYSIKGEMPYSEWKESIRSIIHPSGFKEFSDLNVISITSEGPINLGIAKSTNMKVNAINPDPFLLVNIDNNSSFYAKNNFAMVYEDDKLDDGSVERIYFTEGTALRSYILNNTNKVYNIDDISSQFTGITTNIGGFIVGLSTFKLKSSGIPIFYKEFVGSASTIIDLENNKFIIPNHNFQTGQEIIYISNSGTAIGIATTSYALGTLDVVMKVGAGIGSAIYENGYNSYVPNVGVVTGISTTVSPGIFSQYFGFGNPLPSTVNTGIGTGALFQVLITYNNSTGVPIGTSVQLIDGGKGYSVGQKISIAGTYMGGSTPTNNLYFTISKLSSTRAGTANFTYSNLTSLSTGLGTGAIFNVTRDANKDISSVSIVDGGSGYGSTDQISIAGTYIGGTTPADNLYLSAIELGTKKLPSNIFVRKIDSNSFQVSGLSTTLYSPLDLKTLGSGIQSFNFKNPNENVIISIDNIIQSPLHRKNITIGLSTSIGIGSTSIFISSGINSIFNNDILQIDNEYLKINSIGIGSTNKIDVTREFMGTVSAAHTVGAAVTVFKGDFNIISDTIYFSTPPYGPAIASTDPELMSRSSFAGRVFSRAFDSSNTVDKNIILDDISDQFNGIGATEFLLKSNTQNVVGLYTNTNSSTNINNNPIILINNIFQSPEVDYTIDTSGTNTIRFLSGIPNAGRITNVAITTGYGYQPLVGAAATVSVSAAGTINSITLRGPGSGYRTAPTISIASTIGIGASIVATIGLGGTITGFFIINGGIGYTSTSLNKVLVDLPLPYNNLSIAYTGGSSGNGFGAKASIQVSAASSIIQFDLKDTGVGYKVGDILKVVGITTNPNIGIGFSEFRFTVTETMTDKFSGFYPGQFIYFDDFSSYFNGSRTKFTLTQTVSNNTEVVDLKKNPGSDIILENNIFVYLNDILQVPVESYTFSGSRVIFNEAPKQNSKCTVLFYRGSSVDVETITPPKTIKEGDVVRIGENIYDSYDIEQFDRVVKKIVSSDQLDTYNYDAIGISTDTNKLRPLVWTKQTQDRIINGSLISKARPSLVPTIQPTTKLIKSVNIDDTEIYVNNAFPLFSDVDLLPEEDRNILIIDNKDVNVAIATALVSYASTISSIIISDGGSGYAYTTSPKVAISSISINKKDPILTWSASSGLSTNSNLLSIVYGNPIVSVGQSGLVAISTDGKIYNTVTNVGYSKTITFNSVSFAGTNRYVSVGEYGKIVTAVGFGTTVSSWTEINKYEQVGSFGIIVMNNSNYISTFNDVKYFSNLDKWFCVGYGGTIFSGVGIGTTSFFIQQSNTIQNLNSIAYGNKVVAVGNNGTISKSIVGTYWDSNSSFITSQNLNKIIWDGTRYVVIGNGNIILTSSTANDTWSDWTLINPNITGNFVNINYSNETELYTLLDSNGNLYYSFDLQNWSKRSTNQLNTIKDILYLSNSSNYVLVGNGATSIYSIPSYNPATAISSVSSGIVTSITITNSGFGYDQKNPPNVLIETEKVKIEKIISIKAKGDFGIIVGVDTSIGTGSTIPKLIFKLKSESYDNTTLGIGYSALDSYGVYASGISTGDYFVLYNTNVACGHTLTGITTIGGNTSIVGVANSFIDGVYRAESVQSSGVGIVSVFCSFLPAPGYSDRIFVNANNSLNNFYGKYSWSKIYSYQNRGIGLPQQFIINTSDGLSGISSSPEVTRTRGLFKSK